MQIWQPVSSDSVLCSMRSTYSELNPAVFAIWAISIDAGTHRHPRHDFVAGQFLLHLVAQDHYRDSDIFGSSFAGPGFWRYDGARPYARDTMPGKARPPPLGHADVTGRGHMSTLESRLVRRREDHAC